MTPAKHPVEFSRPLKVDRVPRTGCFEVLTADPAECRELARRLDLVALHSLKAKLNAIPWRGGGLKLAGNLQADLEQVSVVSLEAFRHQVEIPILRYYLPPGVAAPVDTEADVDIIEDGHVDLGEVVSETLSLELDPYPRRPGEVFAEPGEADAPDEKPSPFAKLSGLKGR